MIGFVKGAWGVVRHAGKVAPAIKAVVESRGEISLLIADGIHKWDTDKDGKPDLTTEEALELVVKIIQVVLKRI